MGEDMTGWKMWEHGVPESRLLVISKSDKNKWLVECSCEKHNRLLLSKYALLNGHTKSCGCLHKERTSKANKKYNKYDLTGKCGVGYTSNTNNEFYFDLEDYEKIKEYCWYEHETSPGYHSILANDPVLKKPIKLWHLLGLKGYDHINRNPLDCRKENLRPATQQENMRNISLQKNNKSGVTGVGLHKDGKWRARIMVDYKEINFGLFNEKDDAVKARLNAEIKYFGEFAPQKHLFAKYGIKNKTFTEVTSIE